VSRPAEILEQLLDELDACLDSPEASYVPHPLFDLVAAVVDSYRGEWQRAKLLGQANDNPSPRGALSRPAPGP
jgi:hypothetical protein